MELTQFPKNTPIFSDIHLESSIPEMISRNSSDKYLFTHTFVLICSHLAADVAANVFPSTVYATKSVIYLLF